MTRAGGILRIIVMTTIIFGALPRHCRADEPDAERRRKQEALRAAQSMCTSCVVGVSFGILGSAALWPLTSITCTAISAYSSTVGEGRCMCRSQQKQAGECEHPENGTVVRKIVWVFRCTEIGPHWCGGVLTPNNSCCWYLGTEDPCY
jgi:hypothetical protein